MECEFCQNHEQGDTLYESSDWDGGIGFDYIRDIKYCPICGKKLNSEDEPQTIRCPKCGRSDYIREFGKDFSVTAEEAGFKYKCINCNTYIEPQTDGYMTAEQAEDYRKMLDKAEHKVYGNIEDESQRDCFLCKWLGEVDVCGRCRNRNLFAEADTEPQTDAEITELVKEIVHKMIDDAVIAEDAYPDLRQRMHEAVERLGEYYPSEDERSE